MNPLIGRYDTPNRRRIHPPSIDRASIFKQDAAFASDFPCADSEKAVTVFGNESRGAGKREFAVDDIWRALVTAEDNSGVVDLSLDTSGQGLHKRGYRAIGNDAPLHETLAAGMIQLTRYRGREFFWDPFCGSGTIPIEAALIAINRAPGLNRHFAAEEFPWMSESIWEEVKTEAKDHEFHGDYRILGSDSDPKCVSLAMANARKAGVGKLITFKDGDATKMSLPSDSGILVCNPPYGERMMEQNEAKRLYQALGRHLKFANGWKKYIITSEPEFEHFYGKRCDKKRKFYNGKIQCNYYMYTGNQRKPVKK